MFTFSYRSRTPLSPIQQGLDDNEAPLIQLAVWAPRGNGLAFVYHNDLYYKPKAKLSPVYRLTSSGSNIVSNGLPDWLYQGTFIFYKNKPVTLEYNQQNLR